MYGVLSSSTEYAGDVNMARSIIITANRFILIRVNRIEQIRFRFLIPSLIDERYCLLK